MNELLFSELMILPELQRAVEEMGFEHPTDIQREAIPLIRSGRDVIGKSQTGTGKTLAFAIPAVEKLDLAESETTVQVLILCPTRELAQQGCDEIRKLTRFMQNVWVTDVYGGAPMDRQIAHLKKCNMVIGTPGRIMDHMRRGTLSLANVRLAVLDEADEMLSMGFREDIETILKDVPEEHQTVMFSATMPDAVMEITEAYLREPHIIEINKEQVTLENIRQFFVDVPMGRKNDALNLLLRSLEPKLCMIFCNTKLAVEEVTQFLVREGFRAEALHGDLNQSQRSRVMDGFKSARIPLLVATDVAARGIDVNDIDYVINYDVPGHDEYYIHRIGRTGRAGKEGCAVTICAGRHQNAMIRQLAEIAKSEIARMPIPKVADLQKKQDEKCRERLIECIQNGIDQSWQDIVSSLMEEGFDLQNIAAAALQCAFQKERLSLQDIVFERKSYAGERYRKVLINIGRRNKIAPNHIVSAIAERTGIPGKEIGKIEIFEDHTLVGLPFNRAQDAVFAMRGLRINGCATKSALAEEDREPSLGGRIAKPAYRAPSEEKRHVPGEPAGSGRKIKLSEQAKRRLLDTSDLSRFEIKKKRGEGKPYEKQRADHAPRGEGRRGEGRRGDRRSGHESRRGERRGRKQ